MSNLGYAIIDHVGKKAGMDNYTLPLALHLKMFATKVVIISNFKANDKSIQVLTPFITHSSSIFIKMFNHFWSFLYSAIFCFINNYKITIIHLFSYGAKDVYSIAILRLLGREVVAIVHDVESFTNDSSSVFQKFILKYLCNKLMVHNNYSYQSLIAKYPDLKQKIKIIPHGNFNYLAIKDEMSKEEAQNRLGLKRGTKYILFFGQIKKVKGLDILLRSIPLLSNQAKVILLYNTLISIKVIFPNFASNYNLDSTVIKDIQFISDEKRALYFRAADILVLPYRQIFQSGVLLMAMSYKIPIVASDLPPMKEIINNNENGLLFESNNEKSLALTLNKFFTMSELEHLKIANNAFEYVSEKHSWQNIAFNLYNW